MPDNVTLSAKQRRGVAALLTCPTMAAAALQARVAEKTLYRWMALPVFAAELKKAQTGIIDTAAGRLVQGLTQALDTLSELMATAESEGVRRAAASEWLSQCLAIREQTEIEKRLTALEKRL